MKRMISVLLCLAFLLFIPATVHADIAATAAGTFSDEDWKIDEDGNLFLYDSFGFLNRADAPWYDQMSEIRTATLAEGITRITDYCLCDAVNMESVSIPDGITYIGLRAFSACESLKALELPESIERIDYWAFAGCTGLEELFLSGNLKQVSNYVFQDCSGLRRVVIDASIERLGYDCFENCISLESLYLPKSLTIIDQYALNNCPRLNTIYFEGTAEEWEKIDKTDNSAALADVTVYYESDYTKPDESIEEDTDGLSVEDESAAEKDKSPSDQGERLDNNRSVIAAPGARVDNMTKA